MSSLSDAEFQKQFESGELQIDRHDLLLRIAFIYLKEDLAWLPGVFAKVEKLHSLGLSFGKENFKFNRTLDVFYLSQMVAAVYRMTDGWDNQDVDGDNFDVFYAKHSDLLREDVWKNFYSPAFLAQPSTARFWRLPNLRDLTDTSDPLGGVRREGANSSHFTKLPRWSNLLKNTQRRQPNLPNDVLVDLAISTLKDTIARQRKHCPAIQPYSETQTRYYLKNTLDVPVGGLREDFWSWMYAFGTLLGQGALDAREWEADYSRERWESVEGRNQVLEPDLDGTRKSEVEFCGWPDGGVGGAVGGMGWVEELGSEEEVTFLAAVAAKEVETLDGEIGMNYAIRSHMLLGILRAVFETGQARVDAVEELKRQVVLTRRLDEDVAGPWIEKALGLMEPFAIDAQRPEDTSGWSLLLRRVLEENGQLFGRWQQWGGEPGKSNLFVLKPRWDLVTTGFDPKWQAWHKPQQYI
ncbi:hypothetical protein F5X68DRAFT_278044 [Plectosphaerella plurivora]|uniref:Uncharacterized protein n=1 Tax=Plectosphaerella plurivora TaxID=936078 RepID=A0A9P8V5X8_9PEZI|nr:hypothetical protein F5X68DRAFT_278044 [Plectosphaerella plurivora]